MRDEKATILGNERLNNDYFKLIVNAPYIAKNTQPGQFVLLRINKGLDPLLRRPLGIYRVKEDEVQFLIQIAGRGTDLLSKKTKGESIWLLGPLGNGFTVDDSRRSIMVAGGVGIAPLVQMGEDYPAEILFFGAKAKEQLISRKEIGRIAKRWETATEDGSSGYHGLVSDHLEAFLSREAQSRDYFIYVSGPRGLIKRVAQIADQMGMRGEATLDERMACGVGACLGCAVETKNGTKMVCKDGPVFPLDQLIFD